ELAREAGVVERKRDAAGEDRHQLAVVRAPLAAAADGDRQPPRLASARAQRRLEPAVLSLGVFVALGAQTDESVAADRVYRREGREPRDEQMGDAGDRLLDAGTRLGQLGHGHEQPLAVERLPQARP